MLNNIAQYDRKQLRRDVRGVVLCVAAFIITMSVVSITVIVIGAVADMMQNADTAELLRLSSSLSTSAGSVEFYNNYVYDAYDKYAGIASVIGMICGLPWFFIISRKGFVTSNVTRYHSKVKPGTILLLFVIIMGIQFFMTLVQLGLEPLFNQGGGSLTDKLDESTVSLATSFWGALYIVIIGPICEELVFRGAVLRKLERYGANFAIVVSALIFGLYHIILFQAAFAFLIGLVLAYTAGRFSIKWSILLHMANNAMAVLTVAIGSAEFNAVLNVCYMLAMVATVIILVVKRGLLVKQKRAGAPSEANVYARAFSSPWLIIYIVICLLGGISLLGVF